MTRSMTGFGRGEAEVDGVSVVVEVTGLNHRFLDAAIRLPGECAHLEAKLRGVLKDRLARGRVTVNVDMAATDDIAARAAVFDADLASSYVERLRKLATQLGLKNDLAIADVIALPGVTDAAKLSIDTESLERVLMDAFGLALDVFDAARSVEGAALNEDIVAHVNSIGTMTDSVETRIPEVVDSYRKRLQARVADLDQSGLIEPDRIAAEVALFADKCDVSEEVVRLRSHVARFLDILDGDEPVGRQLDFLCQEMHREITTIGSKGRDSDISHIVVEAKGELEKVREQVQNIE